MAKPFLACADCLELRLRTDGEVNGSDEVLAWASTIVDGRAVCLEHAKVRIRAVWQAHDRG